jgi:DNA-binding response OmpR family regulator
VSGTADASTGLPASILVVDDDRRVVELMTIALNAYGYRVLQAADGEEALRVAATERPDLVVLDVRLPKRSGYEVCELLRQDPEDPDVPIIMVSAAAETEARLQGLTRGADDYVPKPFSPKELIARIKRLLARATLSREARRRGREMEHELNHAREDARRSHAELQGAQQLREVTLRFVHDFHGAADEERWTARLLLEAQTRLGSGMVALLGAGENGVLEAVAVRGDAFERVARLTVKRGTELGPLLAGLGRPVRRRELERFPELRAELEPFVAAGVTLIAPLRSPEAMLGVLVADERLDGRDLDRLDLDVTAMLCDTAALALASLRRGAAQAMILLDQLDAMAGRDVGVSERGSECAAAALVRVTATGVRPLLHELVVRAIRLLPWAEDAGAAPLAELASRDPSGTGRRLRSLIERASLEGAPCDDLDTEARTAVHLIRFGRVYTQALRRGAEAEAALDEALRSEAEALGEPLSSRMRASAVRRVVDAAASASRSR